MPIERKQGFTLFFFSSISKSYSIMKTLESYIEYLRYEKRCSENTITAYQHDIEQFFLYMDKALQITELNNISSSDIRTWILTLLEDEQHTARTVNRKISALKAFYRYHLKIGDVSYNPMLQIHAPKFSKKLPEYVEEKDMGKLFEGITFSDDFEGRRDRLILELFYATGIRLSELLGIKKLDVDFFNSSIKVLGKRNKERIIPFGSNLHNLLTSYMEYYEKTIVPDINNYYIFVAANGKQLYPKAIYRIVRKYLDMVTTIDKRSPHVIRHTFATHLLNNGADLNAIKEILGHSSLAATQVYTQNSMEQLKSIYKQAHPRA